MKMISNRKGWFSFNVQTVAGADLKINSIVARWPGSSHDQTIFNSSVLLGRLERGEFGHFIIVGDSGYKNSKYLATPFLNYADEDAARNLYNESQIRTRNVVERSYGVWKRRFPILSVGIRLHVARVEAVIVATAVLHNIAIDFKDRLPQSEIPGFDQMMADMDDDEAEFMNHQHELAAEVARTGRASVTVRDALVERYFSRLL